MDNNQLLDAIATMITGMKNDLYDVLQSQQAVLQSQQISNYLALSTNPNVPADVQQMALEKAMNMMGLTKNKAQQQFEELSSQIL